MNRYCNSYRVGCYYDLHQNCPLCDNFQNCSTPCCSPFQGFTYGNCQNLKLPLLLLCLSKSIEKNKDPRI